MPRKPTLAEVLFGAAGQAVGNIAPTMQAGYDQEAQDRQAKVQRLVQLMQMQQEQKQFDTDIAQRKADAAAAERRFGLTQSRQAGMETNERLLKQYEMQEASKRFAEQVRQQELDRANALQIANIAHPQSAGGTAGTFNKLTPDQFVDMVTKFTQRPKSSVTDETGTQYTYPGINEGVAQADSALAGFLSLFNPQPRPAPVNVRGPQSREWDRPQGGGAGVQFDEADYQRLRKKYGR